MSYRFPPIRPQEDEPRDRARDKHPARGWIFLGILAACVAFWVWVILGLVAFF